MLNKRLRNLLLFLILMILVLPSTMIVEASLPIIDKRLLDKGVISINYVPTNNARVRIRIMKDKSIYEYEYTQGKYYPLSLGNGQYTVIVGVVEAGTGRARVVAKEEIELALDNSNEVFLQTNQLVDFHEELLLVKKAKELTENIFSDEDKVNVIYQYIIENVSYDYDKAKNVQANYLPDLSKLYVTNKGICFDYASMFAAMTRSVGIPTKLLMGYHVNSNVYHAWNQVYIADRDEWVTIDTTYASMAGQAFEMEQDAKQYNIYKIY